MGSEPEKKVSGGAILDLELSPAKLATESRWAL